MTQIREELQGLGDFEVVLRDDTPALIRNDLLHIDRCGFGHIVVTAVQSADPRLTWATLKEAARYAGVIRRREGPGNTVIRGSGLATWLATEDGLDNWTVGYPQAAPSVTPGSTASFFGDVSFDHVIGILHPPALGKEVVEIRGDPYNYEAVGVSRREAIDHACQHWGAEWRMLPSFTVLYGPPDSLYASATNPTVIFLGLRDGIEGGRDPNLIGVLADLQPSADVESFTSMTVMTGGETGFGPAFGVAGGDDTFIRDPQGAPARFRRVISDGQTTTGIDQHAETQLERYQATHRQLTITADGSYDVRQDASVGSTVLVYGPDEAIFDLGQQYTYRAGPVFPQRRRIVSITWEPQPNQGVYFVPGDGTFTVYDLTPWVEFSAGPTTITAGSTDLGLPFQRARTPVLTGPV